MVAPVQKTKKPEIMPIRAFFWPCRMGGSAHCSPFPSGPVPLAAQRVHAHHRFIIRIPHVAVQFTRGMTAVLHLCILASCCAPLRGRWIAAGKPARKNGASKNRTRLIGSVRAILGRDAPAPDRVLCAHSSRANIPACAAPVRTDAAPARAQAGARAGMPAASRAGARAHPEPASG